MQSLTVKKFAPLCIVCLLAIFLQSGIPAVAGMIPYLAFCACALLVNRGSLRLSSILKILLVGLFALPVFDVAYAHLVTVRATGVFAIALLLFLQTAVYFAVFVLVNGWIDRTKRPVLRLWLILAGLVLVYAFLEGWAIADTMRALNEVIAGGSMVCDSVFTALAALDSHAGLHLLSALLFYAGLFCTSVSLSPKD